MIVEENVVIGFICLFKNHSSHVTGLYIIPANNFLLLGELQLWATTTCITCMPNGPFLFWSEWPICIV